MFRVLGFGFRFSDPGSGFRVPGLGFRVPGSRFRVSVLSFRFRVPGLRFRVSGFGSHEIRDEVRLGADRMLLLPGGFLGILLFELAVPPAVGVLGLRTTVPHKCEAIPRRACN